MQWYAELVLLSFFTAIGFFFALAETALLTLGKWRLRQVTAHSPERGVFIRKLLASPQDLLATITLGNTIAHGMVIVVALVLGWQIVPAAGFHGSYLLNGFVGFVIAVALILFSEILPKTLAVRRPEVWAPRVARIMLWQVQLTGPVRRVAQFLNNRLMRVIPQSVKPLTALSDEEYRELLELAWQSGALGISEKEIILNITNLDRRTVSDLMRPRSQMATIMHNLSTPDMVKAARKFHHRRLPMYGESPDSIVGILNAPKLLANPEVDPVEVIDFPSFVPEEMNLLELLKNFQNKPHTMAIVLDEFGSTTGLVTLEDILADVLGGLRREGDDGQFIMQELESGKWRLSGNVWLEDFRREYPKLNRAAGVDTIGGLVSSQLDFIPPEGTTVEFSGIEFCVIRADSRRVLEVTAEISGGSR
tara:strand:- start:315 stop:1574 length:1260 start_codon:yes stop_codon:yes gene_type:complete